LPLLRLRRFAEVAARDIRNRAQGARARLRALGQSGAEVRDGVLVQRVRAKLGRYVSHPKAIAVTAIQGSVDLTGDVLASEHQRLLKAVGAVRGVNTVEDRLRVHESGEHVPSLQGGTAPAGEPVELLQSHWSPAARVIAGGAGVALLAYGLARRGPLGVAAAIAGVAILARASTNRPLAELADRPLDGREVPLAPQPEPGAWNNESP
jgi:hypothetical protein